MARKRLSARREACTAPSALFFMLTEDYEKDTLLILIACLHVPDSGRECTVRHRY